MKRVNIRGRTFAVQENKKTGELEVLHKHRGRENVVYHGEKERPDLLRRSMYMQTGPVKAYQDHLDASTKYREAKDARWQNEMAGRAGEMGASSGRLSLTVPRNNDVIPDLGIANGREGRTRFVNGKWTKERW